MTRPTEDDYRHKIGDTLLTKKFFTFFDFGMKDLGHSNSNKIALYLENQKTNCKPKFERPRSITPYFHSFHFTIALLGYKR